MQSALLYTVHRTTQYINDFVLTQNGEDNKQLKQQALVEFVNALFEQFKYVAEAHNILLTHLNRACKTHKIDIKLYDMNYYWYQVQAVVSIYIKKK